MMNSVKKIRGSGKKLKKTKNTYYAFYFYFLDNNVSQSLHAEVFLANHDIFHLFQILKDPSSDESESEDEGFFEGSHRKILRVSLAAALSYFLKKIQLLLKCCFY